MDGNGPVLLGIDLLDLARAPAAELLARRILGPGDAPAVGAGYGVAAHLALKEAIIKAAGGRPPGFRWQDAVIGEALPAPSRPAGLVQMVAAVTGGGRDAAYVTCRLDGGLEVWARARLAVGAGPRLRCRGACAAIGAAELVAVVMVEPAADGAPAPSM